MCKIMDYELRMRLWSVMLYETIAGGLPDIVSDDTLRSMKLIPGVRS